MRAGKRKINEPCAGAAEKDAKEEAEEEGGSVQRLLLYTVRHRHRALRVYYTGCVGKTGFLVLVANHRYRFKVDCNKNLGGDCVNLTPRLIFSYRRGKRFLSPKNRLNIFDIYIDLGDGFGT